MIGSSSNDNDGIDANDGEQLQEPQITGSAKEQLIRGLYDRVANGGDREDTKNIEKDPLDRIPLTVIGSSSDGDGSSSDRGGDSNSNGGDGSGSGDGGSSGVDGGEQLQHSETKEATMEQRMVTASDDSE